MRSLPKFLSKQPYIEPVKEVFFSVKSPDGKEITLRRWRNSINEPLQYEILEKKLEVRIADIQIQEEAIRRQILAENPSPMDWTIEGFILILKNILREEHGYLKMELESNSTQEKLNLYESDHPLILFLEISPYLIERIFYNIDKVIDVGDREFLKDFARRHNERDDVMLLKVAWDFE